MHADPPAGPLRSWLSTVPVLLLLLLTVAQGTSEIVQARMLETGEWVWPGYAELRSDPPAPTCDPDDYRLPEGAVVLDAADEGEDDLLDDLLGEEPADDAPVEDDLLDDLLGEEAPADAPAIEDDLLDDLLGEEEPPAAPPADAPAVEDDLLDDLLGDEPADDAPVEDDLLDDLLGDEPAGDAPVEDDLLDDLLGDEPADDAAPETFTAEQAAAMAAALERCETEQARHAELQAMITPGLRTFRSVDAALAQVTDAGRSWAKPSLVFLLLLSAITATLLGAHIALRPARFVNDHRFSEAVQIAVHGAAVGSCLYHYQVIAASGVDRAAPWLPLVWAAGFTVMSGANAYRIARPPEHLQPGGSLLGANLAVPLYVVMGMVASVWFLGFEDHPAGLSIYLDKLTAHAALYIQVGLYVWAGMLLKHTRLAHLSFDLLRPWKMPPELLAAIVVVAAAVPTAYSGASGIFVIAAGAIIYDELRQAGARNQLALAATAMSGSLGVVLSPCLLVVIVAALNKQVTTTQLFGAGTQVFALTAALFVGFVLFTRKNPITVRPAAEALPHVKTALGRLLPYVALFFAVVAAYGLVLDAWLDEHSAPKILLVVLLVFVVYEGWRHRDDDDEPGAAASLGLATDETTVHIGALLTLMALSVGFGGVVERSELMSMVPADLGSPFAAMGVLTIALVLIGMLMDPYGAVILVSATIAQVAYGNGIDPLHFWMVVLVAFELGYLTPPVALNHLLTASVVGEDALIDDLPPDAGFWARHERYLLPVTVMGIALVIVAFGPLLVA